MLHKKCGCGYDRHVTRTLRRRSDAQSMNAPCRGCDAWACAHDPVEQTEELTLRELRECQAEHMREIAEAFATTNGRND